MSPPDAPRLERTLTSRGRAVALAALFAWLLAWTVGGALAFAAAALVALLGVGLLFAWTPLGRIRIGALPPAAGTAGKPFDLRVPVRHEGRFGVLRDAVLRVSVGSGTRPLGFLAALRPGGEELVHGVHRIGRRGRHSRLLVLLEATDPLGLLRATARHEVSADLLVLPRVVHLGEDGAAPAARSGSTEASPSPRGSAQEPFGVREWRAGESLRHVHWRLSARRGALMVREMRGEERPATHLVLDPRVAGTGRERRRAFEDVITLAASLAAKELGTRHAVRLTVAGAEQTTARAQRGRSTLPAVLTTLVDVEPLPVVAPLAPVRFARGETAIVVTAGAARDAALGEWAQAGARVLDTDDDRVRASLRAKSASRRAVRKRRRRATETALPSLRVAGWFGTACGAGLLLHAGAPAGAVAALALAPGAAGRFERAGVARTLRRVLPIALVSLAVVALGTVLVADTSLGVLGLLVAALSLAVGRLPDETARTAVPGLVLAFAVAAVALVAGGGPGLALLLLAPLAFHAAATVVSTRRRTTVARATLRTSEPHRRGRRRALRSLAAGLAFAALLAAFQPLAAWAPLRSVNLEGDRSGDRDGGVGRPGARGRGVLSAAATGHQFPTGVSGESIPLPGYEIVMEVEPREAAGSTGSVGPLLLRGLALTRLGPGGPQANSRQLPARVRDADDGAVDGWARVGRSVPEAERLELRVSHYDMPIPPHDWSLLFTTDATEAIGLADLRHDPERFAVLDEAPAEWFTYDLRVRDPRQGRLVSAQSSAEAASGWHVQLPPVSRELTRVADEARRITAGAASDLEKVERVIAHFRSGYTYSRDASRTCDAAGAVDLFAKREGFCTHFAAASLLMLRTQGIPARLVSGFMVHEWDASLDAYVVRPRDLHSWIEVRFADVGWVAFDPTPPDASRGGGGTVEVTKRWAERVVDDLGALLGGGGASALRSLGDTLLNMPWGVRLLLAALVLAAALTQIALLVRGPRGAPGETRDPAAREALRLAERLERALARRGYRRGAAETRRELADRVVLHESGASAAALLPAVRDLDAARFGHVPLSAEARAQIDGVIRALVS